MGRYMKNRTSYLKYLFAKGIRVLGIVCVFWVMILAIDITAPGWTDWISGEIAHVVSQAKTSEPALLVDLNREASNLIGVPRSYARTSAKASEVVAEIRRGDFASAAMSVQETLQQSRMLNWCFRPFGKFIVGVSQRGDETFLNQLNKWVEQDKNSSIPYLLRALYYYKTAWLMRGTGFVSDTETNKLNAFQRHIDRAATDVKEAIRLDGNNPYSLYLWMNILSAYGNTPELEAAFRQAIQRFPGYYPLYLKRLASLAPKWGGSPKEMYKFVETYAGKAGASSPLKMLYLQLYADLLDAVRIACYGEGRDCIAVSMDRLVTKDLIQNVYAALQLYNHLDQYEFTREVGNILETMVRARGTERYAGFVLQLVADSMGSDIQLSATDTSKNNFMIDELTGYVWFQKEHYDNAVTQYQRAIADMPNMRFPDEEEKDMALAEIYDKLAEAYNGANEYEKVVIYQKAADALADIDHPGWSLKCQALFRLKLYGETIKDCTAEIAKGGDVGNAYWRARAYEDSGQTEAALRDFRQVADSESQHSANAAIEISVIYGRRNDMLSQLKALNSYKFLYDEAHQTKEVLAIAYNNRCYAHMQLGNLQEALQDCTASLRFDSLPDAIKKQQELLKRLKAKEVGA